LEPLFDKIEGVISTTSGYAGGRVPNPTYEQVCEGNTGHLEVVKIVFNPSKVDYSRLLEVFWHHIDPTDPKGQFCDKGEQYLSAIFYTSETQKHLAEQSKAEIVHALKGQPIYTQIRPLSAFYPAENYHQSFYEKNPAHYQSYRSCCGRDQRLKELWG
jgi:peptide-methionine (S)-S-oxide reductase